MDQSWEPSEVQERRQIRGRKLARATVGGQFKKEVEFFALRCTGTGASARFALVQLKLRESSAAKVPCRACMHRASAPGV